MDKLPGGRATTQPTAKLTWRIVRLGSYLTLALLLLIGVLWWKTKSPPVPSDARRVLFQGVTYIREVRHQPRPLVIHVVTVDLDAPGLGFLVTPGNPKRSLPLRARTTSGFLQEFKVQVAINGDFFSPWHSTHPLSYYPHVGDPVQVDRFASSRGVVYCRNQPGSRTLYLSRDNQANFGKPVGAIYNAISGNGMLVESGQLATNRRGSMTDLQPRTAIGLNRNRKRLIMGVVDGRQSHYSEGVTQIELAAILIKYGSWTAVNLDGGGSTALVMQGAFGEPVVLNSPIDNHIPGRERPVGNHLGVFAQPSEASP